VCRLAKDGARGADTHMQQGCITASLLYCYRYLMSTFVTVQKRGTIALPPDLRRRYHLDEPGAQVELTEREDGVIELRPKVAIPADQTWFWTDRWQEMEREAAEAIKAGDMVRSDSVDEFLTELDSDA
jgi:antitoxin MazE